MLMVQYISINIECMFTDAQRLNPTPSSISLANPARISSQLGALDTRVMNFISKAVGPPV